MILDNVYPVNVHQTDFNTRRIIWLTIPNLQKSHVALFIIFQRKWNPHLILTPSSTCGSLMINTIHREKIIYIKKIEISNINGRLHNVIYLLWVWIVCYSHIMYSVHDARHGRHVLIKGVPTPMYSYMSNHPLDDALIVCRANLWLCGLNLCHPYFTFFIASEIVLRHHMKNVK